jgi:hypothetical protein
MRRQEDERTFADGPTLGHEEVRMVPRFAEPSIPTGPPLDCQRTTVLDDPQSTLEGAPQWRPVSRRRWQQPAFLRFPYLDVLDAFPLASLLVGHVPWVVRGSLLAEETWTCTDS